MTLNNLEQVRERFISRWGMLGQAWGISRTMAQIQGLLLISDTPMNTDQIMEQLAISRGNAHNNLKELLTWKLARKVFIKGDRKEYYVCEKDPWSIFCTVARERQRREIEPLLDTLQDIQEELTHLPGQEARTFQNQVASMSEFAELGNRILDRVGRSEKSKLMKWLMTMA